MGKGKAIPLMIQGTSSDAGKSVLVTAFCRIFAEMGYQTAPFKSQNMALNSYITVDGKEIGRAQGVQAEAAGIRATTDMNPILIKPSRLNESQIVVHGEPYQNMEAKAYRSEFFPIGKKLVKEAYERLAAGFERIIIEGAGSPAEINLNDRELVNMRVARMADAPVLLVADIERGGVFASLVGTLQLLEPEDRDRVIGVIINKFRGDVSLLQPGLDWFENYTGKPVLGVVPYIHDLRIDAEDSLSLNSYKSSIKDKTSIDIAVIRYPRISNFTDIDPFFPEEDCHIRFVTNAADLGEPDLIILPGSKNTIEDLLFLREQGMEKEILRLWQERGTFVFGICGGYQMLGQWIHDPNAIESPQKTVEAMQMIPMETTLAAKKTTQLAYGLINYAGETLQVKGYEIHMGQSSQLSPFPAFIKVEKGEVEGVCQENKRVIGTYFHGIFHNDTFRWHFLNQLRKDKGLLPLKERISYEQLREQGFFDLAQQIRKHVQLEQIHEQMIAFAKKREQEKGVLHG
jgi:adenosylcobyric acid synthase